MRRAALLRAAVAPLFVTALGVTALGVTVLGPAVPVAAAAPLVPTPAAPGDDDATDPDRPVQIDVGRFEPRTLTPGQTVRVTGRLTNSTDSTITDLAMRLQRGDVMRTRAELAAAAADPDPATAVLPVFEELRGELEPGGALDFDYTIPSADLQLVTDGVYPVLLNVNGAVDGDQRRVGELATFVIQQSVLPPAQTTVAWLWPVVERTHRDASGDFVDDDLASVISDGGRLDRALSVVERLPDTTGPDGRPVPAVPVTLAVDPALVEELTVMAAGPYDVAGEDGAGTGTEEAVAFLDRLRELAADHPVVALPYGDVDADALDAAGRTDVVLRSLPGPAPAADPAPAGGVPAEGSPDTSSAPTPAPGASPGDGSGPAVDVTPAPGAGARILTDALDVTPRTDLVWPAGGVARAATLATLQAHGISRAVLGTDGLTGGARAAGVDGTVATVRSQVTTTGGALDVLVADSTLGGVAGEAEDTPGGARLAEQRYLAELALITLQAPLGSTPTVLVAPPRDIDAGPDGAGAMMGDTVGLTWLRPGTLAGLAAGAPADVGAVAEPRDAVLLDPAGLVDIGDAVAVRDDLAEAVVGDPETALRPYDAAVSRATSVAWRDDPEGFRDAAADVRSGMERLRDRVTLLAPADGTYSLASSDAPLVLTVNNELPFAVEVLLDLRVRGNPGLSIGDIGPQVLAPGERTTLQVPTQVRQSGGFAVTARLTTPSGGPLGERVDLQVKSTAYGPISLIITIGAAALLALLFLRRLVRFVLRRRRAAAGPAPEDTSPVRPPTRSPV